MNISAARKVAASLVLCCVLAGSLLYAQTAKNPPPPAEYELSVGNTTYDVTLDQPVTIKTSSGEELQIVLHHKKTLKYEGYGIKFNYPSDMKVSVEEAIGVATITLDTTGSSMAIVQVYTVPISAAELSKTVLDGYLEGIKSKGGKVRKESIQPSKRRIGDSERPGKRFKWTVGEITFTDEIYVFPKGKSMVSIVLQSTTDEAKSAQEKFVVISSSFE